MKASNVEIVKEAPYRYLKNLGLVLVQTNETTWRGTRVWFHSKDPALGLPHHAVAVWKVKEIAWSVAWRIWRDRDITCPPQKINIKWE